MAEAYLDPDVLDVRRSARYSLNGHVSRQP
jgi:hypothetical protein